jgi:predicted alpha/beta-fold hydrolase
MNLTGAPTQAKGSDFEPAWWLPGPHLQTVWAPLVRKVPPLQRERERIWLADGDFIDLDWYGPHDAAVPIVLLLHGLTGSSSSHYIVGLQKTLADNGQASVALNWRGCSGEPNLMPRAYHSGASDDLTEVIHHVQRKRPMAPLYAVGYSLGGNILLKHLGETGEHSGISKAAAISVPFRLDQCADRLGLGLSKIYQRYFVRRMIAYVRDKQRLFAHQGLADRLTTLEKLGPLDGMRTFWDFDGRVTAPLHGFKDAADYYRKASSAYYLEAIEVPTLIIQSRDDPFVLSDCIPTHSDVSACTTLEVWDRGGHVGFIDGPLCNAGFYLERRIPLWFAPQS